jgi:hypothetical protein
MDLLLVFPSLTKEECYSEVNFDILMWDKEYLSRYYKAFKILLGFGG